MSKLIRQPKSAVLGEYVAMAKKKKKKKKSLKKRIRQLKRKIVKKLQDAYYINRFYKCPVKENTVLIESKHGEDVAGNM